MEELKSMIARRGIFKRQLTNFATFVGAAENDGSKLKQVNSRLEQIRNVFTEFQNTQTSIELIEDTEAQTQERDMFENKYYEILSKAQELLTPRCESFQPNAITPLRSQIKLPQIQLPSFSGNYDDFMSFHDIFKSLIHDNTAINSIQKFHYLAAALKGDAAKIISALEMSADNYEIACQLIKDRYENKKLIVQNHIKQIFDIQAISKESHRDLRELLDNFVKHFRALRNIGQPVDQWGSIIIYLLTCRLDYNSRKEWEIVSKANQDPTTDDFLRFLQDRCQILESINSHNAKTKSQSPSTTSRKLLNHVTVQPRNCILCKGEHYIYSCSKFLELTQPQRLQEIKRLKGCINCLRTGHKIAECKSSFRCRSCNQRHNSLLHFDDNQAEIKAHSQTNQVLNTNNAEIALTASSNENAQDMVNAITAHASTSQSLVLLSTAIVNIFDSQGRAHKARALIDSGSMSNFMTKALFQKLNLIGNKINMHIAGISSKLTSITLKSNAIIKSRFSNYQTDLSFLIIETLTENLPQVTFDKANLGLPTHVQLADENFNKAEPVDLLLGAGIFLDLLGTGQIKIGKNKPTLQETKLGWILAGHININSNNNNLCFLATKVDIQSQLEKFWEIEECPNTIIMSGDDILCEQHFVNNYKREAVTGKFIVKLPCRDDLDKLGETRDIAISRFISNENKLKKNKVVYDQYRNFMKEYVQLGHMTEVGNNHKADVTCYLPHHSVIKNSSLTTKCRVVFDASCKSSSGLSLNDLLLIGPKVQDDLFAIVIRSRKHNIVVLADITKMYRQILVDPSQRSLQRIIWRDNETESLRVYELNTVTYGTAPASFLATRCLNQLGLDHRESFPKASKAITNDFYVDNLITGASDIDGAKRLAKDVQTILDSASFELRQWMSNEPKVLAHLAKNTKIEQFIITDTTNGNALGITWNSQRDHFLYSIDVSALPVKHLTKRHILSVISKIFDPLGLIGPVIITAKIMLQSLWKYKLDWDETVPFEIDNKFKNFISHLSHLNEITVPRKILLPSYNLVEIHGFCDASTLAYGACVYIKSRNDQGKSITRLVCAKSRVSPIKPITIPRLELCSAVLLCKLVVQTVAALDMKINHIYYWSDSTIALSWIRTDPSKLKTFVSHRVSQVQQLTRGTWKHVKSNENPADLISRGACPKDLSRSRLWWEGPPWLAREDYEAWSDGIENENSLGFQREIKPSISLTIQTTSWDICSKFSSFAKLTHVIAYVNRFINNCKNKKIIGLLTPSELDEAVIKLIKIAQQDCYINEIKALRSQKQVQTGSSLSTLNPFIDQNGVIRVGGRLQKSLLAFPQKHQIILPPKHALTTLLIKNEHHRNLHAGLQAISCSLRENYWVINGRQAIRSVVRKCVTCFKAKPLPLTQQMGELPNYRVQPARAFSSVGVDYAGPFELKDGKTRNRKLVKAYICVFVCLCTKAVHLELVGDLTSLGFLNALKRFVSRRGLCKLIISDNAGNFTGANNVIKGIIGESQFRNYVIDNRIEWKFIPARSPHYGGLWEASVKNVKYYLKRLLNQTKFTFEEFYTFITQVEAILNSRPITALSSDPHDLEALTPGHFIIGAPLNSLPQEQIEATAKVNTLTKYQHLQQLAQHFWSRWSHDYLNTLQQRTKWKFFKKNEDLAAGSLAIIKEDNQPPCQWSLGRITTLHKGSDGLVRAVSVQTRKGEIRRALNKICLLPIE